MPDLDNDNPTPDFNALIEQARRLCEERKYDEAIELAVSVSLKVSINYYNQFSSINEAVDTCKQIFDTLNKIRPDEVVDSPGKAYAMLAICASVFSENDPYHLAQTSRSRASAYGWTDFHTKSYWTCVQTPDAECDEALEKLRRIAQENPAAWFYVGEFEGFKETCLENARDAFLQVPENDPNYVRAMLRAGEYYELCAESMSDAEALYGFRCGAEDCYERAIEKSPRSQEVRSAYLYNHFKLLLEEAAENGFDRDRVVRASEFIGKIFRVLSGEPVETEQEGNSASSRLSAERDTIFWAQLLQSSERRIIEQVFDLIRKESQQTREEIRAGREDVQNLREQLEANIAASVEMIHKYVVERLQAYQEQIADCERRLNGDHSEFWEQLAPESRRYLATGDYIREKSPAGMECSGEAIEYTKALETELRQHLIKPFVSFAEQRGCDPNIFDTERDKVTLGNIYHKLDPLGLRTEFANSLGERGRFLLTDFHILKRIKKLRDAAAHGGDIGRRQASELRDMVLKILPKIVAMCSH